MKDWLTDFKVTLLLSLRSKKLNSLFLLWEFFSAWLSKVRWYNYMNNIHIICLDSQTRWVKEHEMTLDISTLKNCMGSLQLVKNRLRRTHISALCDFLHICPSLNPIIKSVLLTKGISRSLVTWKLLIVWTTSSPSSVLLQLVMGQVAQCHPLRVSERGNMGRPLGR